MAAHGLGGPAARRAKALEADRAAAAWRPAARAARGPRRRRPIAMPSGAAPTRLVGAAVQGYVRRVLLRGLQHGGTEEGLAVPPVAD
eukprot:15466423-Alexandrium_andersonii.AAC.1